MAHSLDAARALAQQYRYSGDLPTQTVDDAALTARRVINALSKSGLQITQSLTPKLFECLITACDNLKFPIDCVYAYVSASSELQAQCFQADDDNCIINLSSGLINLLHADEITFVIGHEIGHHILRHNQEDGKSSSIENLINQRAKEISVDRAGIIACQSLEAALKATMKVISGLPDQYIRFDTSNFINQLRTADREDATLSDSLETHPSLVLRARALLWFSMNDELSLGNKKGSLSLEKINEWVRKDLDKYIDKPARKKIEALESDLLFWMSVKQATLSGKLTKEDRQKLAHKFGEILLEKLISAIQGMDIDEVAAFLNQKITEASQDLTILVPETAHKRIEVIYKKSS
jgi:hypothetical protein